MALVAFPFIHSCTVEDQKDKVQEITVQPESALDSVSYAIGMNVARILKGQGFDTLNYSVFSSAIAQSLHGDTLLLHQQEATRYINNYVLEQVRVLSLKNLAIADAFLDSVSALPDVVELEQGVWVRVIEEGEGQVPELTDEVEIHFQGRLPSGDVFDDSWDRNSPVSFVVNTAIDAWQTALVNLPVGSEAELWLHPDKGYGTQGGYYGIIPSNSALYYRLKLIRLPVAADQ